MGRQAMRETRLSVVLIGLTLLALAPHDCEAWEKAEGAALSDMTQPQILSQNDLAAKFDSFEEMLESVSILDDHHTPISKPELGEVSAMGEDDAVSVFTTVEDGDPQSDKVKKADKKALKKAAEAQAEEKKAEGKLKEAAAKESAAAANATKAEKELKKMAAKDKKLTDQSKDLATDLKKKKKTLAAAEKSASAKAETLKDATEKSTETAAAKKEAADADAKAKTAAESATTTKKALGKQLAALKEKFEEAVA